MKIAIYDTGHEIADTVARSLVIGIPDGLLIESKTPFPLANAHVAYGILRGTSDIFHNVKHWFNVDRGYFKPSHYDGYYRISCRGTQACFNWPEPDYERLEQLKLDIKPWRGFDHSKPVLIIPPTDYVRDFFGIEKDQNKWLVSLRYGPCSQGIIRTKMDKDPIVFEDYSHVVTFNSSVGWQALQAGIPCISDPTYSMMGSWFNNISLDELSDKQLQDRNKLFATMASLQFTLAEIEQGKAWELMSRYLSGSDMTVEKPSLVKSPLIASAEGLKTRFQSNT